MDWQILKFSYSMSWAVSRIVGDYDAAVVLWCEHDYPFTTETIQNIYSKDSFT